MSRVNGSQFQSSMEAASAASFLIAKRKPQDGRTLYLSKRKPQDGQMLRICPSCGFLFEKSVVPAGDEGEKVRRLNQVWFSLFSLVYSCVGG